jgi:integrase
MISAVVVENFMSVKETEYRSFITHLGTAVRFSDDKWVCDKMRRSQSENAGKYTLYFSSIPERYREMVKYFASICLIQSKTIASVRTYIIGLTKFFTFWDAKYKNTGLDICDETIAVKFYQYVKKFEFSEATNDKTWSAVNSFFKTMNGWDGMVLKNPFSISPFERQKKFDSKYIPEDVALQLDKVFKDENISLHLRCAYWLLRLIPSRISEILGMRIDCLKRYNGNYVLFIPSWKQNGGKREPIIRSIHLEETGIAGFLINLIREQQESARQFQALMPEHKKDALFTYRKEGIFKGTHYYQDVYLVAETLHIQKMFKKICSRYTITSGDGQIYEVTTHQFRHNGITDRLAAGFTAAQIAEMTGHHGSAMIFNAYAHLNLLPETIVEKQEYVVGEENSRKNRYILFGGRILNMEEQLEKRLLKNLRAHKVRGGICSDITGCKSDMWNCLECKFFVPDMEQLDYYEEQASLWREKCARFSKFPIIRANAEKNAKLYEDILKKLKDGEYKQ